MRPRHRADRATHLDEIFLGLNRTQHANLYRRNIRKSNSQIFIVLKLYCDQYAYIWQILCINVRYSSSRDLLTEARCAIESAIDNSEADAGMREMRCIAPFISICSDTPCVLGVFSQRGRGNAQRANLGPGVRNGATSRNLA
jgi:hypothetical protein